VNLHLVGGFLGSGKTTAIIGTAKYLMARGKRVGVVTNDQGKYLVDTAFFRLSDVPTVEVAGGCFCCNYDDLEARLGQLIADTSADVVFAESVGSCADMVATVLKPLLQLRDATVRPTSFSVFADVRLLRRRLFGLPMPFSDTVSYIFDQQIEEAGLLVLNKADLLPPESAREVEALARERFPGKSLRIQNSLSSQDVAGWVDLLESAAIPLPGRSLDIDYERYGDGEAQLAWLDEEVALDAAPGMARAAVVRLIGAVIGAMAARQIPIGHLKMLIRWDSGESNLSFTALDEKEWQQEIPAITGRRVTLLINARVEAQTAVLRQVLKQAVDGVVADGLAGAAESNVALFHPRRPRPTHRIR